MSKRRVRARGEGSIFKRADGTWSAKIPIGNNTNGSIKYRYVYGKTQAEVKNKVDEIKGDVRNNTYAEPNKITVKQWLDTWLTVTVKSNIKDTTWLMYESLIRNHINPAIGDIRIMNLQTANIQNFYNEKLITGRLDKRKNKSTKKLEIKEGGLSPKTIKHIHQIINSALKQAVKEKYISSNIAEAVKLPKKQEKEMKILSTEDIKRFLETAQKNKFYKVYYPAYFLELYTGVRRGELLGLRWKDIDFKESRIKIIQQLVKVGSKHFLRDLKTDSSKRVIAIPEEVKEVLKEHKESEKNKLKLLG